MYRKLGGPRGRSGQVRKVSPPRGFDPRTVQPVASRYPDHIEYRLDPIRKNFLSDTDPVLERKLFGRR